MFASGYWPRAYWPAAYWPQSASPPTGSGTEYFPPPYFPRAYFASSYWGPGAVSPPEPPPTVSFTPGGQLRVEFPGDLPTRRETRREEDELILIVTVLEHLGYL
ncbi:MAG: hypothetical protein K2Y51_13720 [Gammaproteobacteria bacterium]|nr:hypothetical protein [Gammaproteobacteria bacterium]